MNVLLSIKPEYAEKIFSGKKLFEYRRSIFRRPDVFKIVVYATMPIGKIVGEFIIKNILEDSPQELWRRTSEVSGISKEHFDEYFMGKDLGFALQISEPYLYDEPIDPRTQIKDFVPPQSFRYIEADF